MRESDERHMADVLTPSFDFDVVEFVTSDTHFGHARISELAGRPFDDVAAMDAELIRRWNTTVSPDAVVLHLGDLSLGLIEPSVAMTAKLNGRRFLVPGNHDRVSSATQSKRAIERFRPLYEQAGWTVLPELLSGERRGRALIASHYPYRGDSSSVSRHERKFPVDEGLPLIHGHTHARDHGAHGRQFHVGVDAFDYAPIPFGIVDEWLRLISDFPPR